MRKIITLFLLFVVKIIFSQDIHFSQPFVDRMYFNPAKVGDIVKADYRFSIQRKSQWESVSIPFSSLSSSCEFKNIYNSFNMGINFLNDKAGSSSLSLNQLNIAISKKLNLLNINSLSVGLLAGFGQKSIDYSELIFEENENFITNKFVFPDFGLGLNYKTNTNKIVSYEFGFSSYHLNSPKNSFNENQNTSLPIKNNFNFGINYRFSTKSKIFSELIYTKQSSQKEMLLGFRPTIELDKIYLFPLIYYRFNDAAIVGVGMEKNNIQANICYDINVSDLTPASNYRGGFEFAIIYVWEKTKDKKTKRIEEKCPKYL
tara:strand:- start:250 stop:1197 length:948 start_codon:yes stop_codon:yes gene_type:complete